MKRQLGNLKVNGDELSVQDADCTLFVGRLGIDTATSDGELAISNIPFPSAMTFEELPGMTFASDDCTQEVYENSIFSPSIAFRNDYFAIRSLQFACRSYSDGYLHVALELYATETESELSLSIVGEMLAKSYPINSLRLLSGMSGPIPIRFAEYYLPMIGCPGICEGAFLMDVVATLGQPNHRGGGVHPQYGLVPKWIRYTLPYCYLHFQFEDDIATYVTIMSLDDPPCDLTRTTG